MRQYYQCTGFLAGRQADRLDWWESLLMSARVNPLKTLATILLSVVPHSAQRGYLEVRTKKIINNTVDECTNNNVTK